jgi:hypothetical protein
LASFVIHEIGAFQDLVNFERLLTERFLDILSIIQHDYTPPLYSSTARSKAALSSRDAIGCEQTPCTPCAYSTRVRFFVVFADFFAAFLAILSPMFLNDFTPLELD